MLRLPRRHLAAFPHGRVSWWLALTWLCLETGAQPSGPAFLQRQLGGAPAHSLTCPAGYYKASGIIWGCGSVLGRRIVTVEPESTTVATKLPAGLKNFSVQVGTSLHIDTQLEDDKTGSFILEGGELMPGFAAPQGAYHYERPSAGAEQILISGVLDRDLLLKARNLAKTGGTVQLDYRFDGMSPCPEVPGGCQAFDKDAAVKEVKAWSDWCKEKYGDVDAAWKAMSAAAQGGDAVAVRRLAAADSISWLGWEKAWNKWNGSKSESSWQESFHLLDADANEVISKSEFSSGYEGTAGEDASAEHKDASAEHTDASANDTDASANHTDASAGRGLEEASGSGSVLPVWIIILVPLVAIAACIAFYLRMHPTMLEQLKDKLPPELNEKLMKTLGKGGKKEALDSQATDQEKTMFLKTEDARQETSTIIPEANSSSGTYSNTRHKFCSLMSCAWGRDEKPPTPMLPPPSDSDEVEGIIEQMRAAKADEGVQEESLKKLEELALDPLLKMRIAECRGVDSVIEAMDAFPKSPAVQEHGCAVLGNQASSNEEQQRALAERGTVRVVVKAMIEHAASFRVQETAVWALRELALADAGRREITDCSGIEHILRAMQTHPAAVAVLEHGCMSLAYLSYDPELRRWIAYDGGVNIIVKAMQSQPDDSVVQEAACLALRNLSCSQEPQQAILELRGDEAILKAMNTHIASPSVVDTGIDALSILGPPQRRLFETGALMVVIQAMKRHRSVESLQAKACTLLAYAAGDAEASSQIRELGGAELVASAQANFEKSCEVQEAAEAALAALG